MVGSGFTYNIGLELRDVMGTITLAYVRHTDKELCFVRSCFTTFFFVADNVVKLTSVFVPSAELV